MGKLIGMNDTISMSLTLWEWQRLVINLRAVGWNIKENDEIGSRTCLEFADKICRQMEKLDFSANEKLVDKINEQSKITN